MPLACALMKRIQRKVRAARLWFDAVSFDALDGLAWRVWKSGQGCKISHLACRRRTEPGCGIGSSAGGVRAAE